MTDPETHWVLLIPGLFGFTTLAGYDYFHHLEGAILDRFQRAGRTVRIERVPSLPTASITSRAATLAAEVSRCRSGTVHLVGHSSGGLDARLFVSPGTALAAAVPPGLRERVRTVMCINTPNYGTPLSAYFSTVSGTRLLYAVSLLTVAGLSIGHLPLSALERLVSAVRAADGLLGLDIQLVDDLTDQVLRIVGIRGRREIREFMKRLMDDQAGIIQIMPEVAELFNAAVEDNPAVRYGCVVTAAPPPGPRRVVSAIVSPMRAVQLGVYTTLYGVSSYARGRYPYATPTTAQASMLARGFGRHIGPDDVDGVVPTLSMLWGELVWCGPADHLDVVGHFEDDLPEHRHVDWLHSGAHFRRRDFAAMVDAVCAFLLR